MDTLNTPPLVLIEWVDSGQPMAAWQWLDQIRNHRPHRCVSVGFLVQDDVQAKVLAPNLGASDGSGDFDQASGLTTIPTAAVQRMLQLSANGASVYAPAFAAGFGRSGRCVSTDAASVLICLAQRDAGLGRRGIGRRRRKH